MPTDSPSGPVCWPAESGTHDAKKMATDRNTLTQCMRHSRPSPHRSEPEPHPAGRSARHQRLHEHIVNIEFTEVAVNPKPKGVLVFRLQARHRCPSSVRSSEK